MTNKTIHIILFILICSYTTHAQNVGINTKEPSKTLDIKGDLTVRKEIRVGKTEGEKGDAGTTGQVLTSRGSGLSPEWKTLDAPITRFKMKESYVLVDSVGVLFTKQGQDLSMSELKENSKIDDPSTGWQEIVGLKSNITPINPNNRVIFTMQTMFQSASSDFNIYYSYVVGLFIDKELKSVRPLDLIGNGGAYIFGSLSLYDSFENLAIKPNNESYTLQVAVLQRLRITPTIQPDKSSSTVITANDWLSFVGTHPVGKDPINTNKWMNRTSLKVELYEITLD